VVPDYRKRSFPPAEVTLTIQYKMDGFAWATIWPPTCLIICITIVYSVIQPVITALAWVAMLLLFSAYKYTLYWCADQPDFLETGGRFYIKALRTVFVSLYLEEICLAGLFFLSTDNTGSRTKSGLACGAIMVSLSNFSSLLERELIESDCPDHCDRRFPDLH
jgi:hypothetical protein